jgi:hypothetical protein
MVITDSDGLRYKLRQTIRALGWWTNDGGWKSPSAIGALIQQKAQELTGIQADMSTLKTEAERMLKRLKTEAAMEKQLQAQKAQGSLTNIMPGSWCTPFTLMSFPVVVPKKTRREELEGYTTGQIRELFMELQVKEIKKDQINYILEAEKEYK